MYRLIVADDEMAECMVLEHMLKQHMKDRIEFAGSVYDGIAFLKLAEEKKPDISIVDINMPGLDGLESIEIIKMKNPGMKVIIHSAYSEFAYTQKAIRLGACDYLLKPNTREEILQSVEKACLALDEESRQQKKQEKIQREKSELQELFYEKWLMSLFLEQPDLDSYEKIKEQYPEVSEGGVFTAWKLQENGCRDDRWRKRAYAKLKRNISSLCNCACIEYQEMFFCLLFPGQNQRHSRWQDWMKKLAEFLFREGRKDKTEYQVGVSRWQEEGNFAAGIYEAKAALWRRDAAGLFFFRGHKEQKSESSWESVRPLVLKGLLGNGEIENAISFARDAFQTIPIPDHLSQEDAFLAKRIRTVCLVLQLEQELERLSQRELWKGVLFWKSFRMAKTELALSEWMEGQLRQLSDAFSGKNSYENGYMERAVSILSKEYAKDWPMEEMAGRLGISSFYLSRLLKRQLGVTFVELLTDIRMRHAMLLLAENQKSIREIGVKTGYANQSYFYKVFKKVTDISVGDVRKHL